MADGKDHWRRSLAGWRKGTCHAERSEARRGGLFLDETKQIPRAVRMSHIWGERWARFSFVNVRFRRMAPNLKEKPWTISQIS